MEGYLIPKIRQRIHAHISQAQGCRIDEVKYIEKLKTALIGYGKDGLKFQTIGLGIRCCGKITACVEATGLVL